MGNDADRARRLAEALRANLRRRKDQARGATDVPGPAEDERDQGPAER